MKSQIRCTAIILTAAAVFFAQPSAGQICGGDCDGSGQVSIGEIITGVNISLGNARVSVCTAMDGDGDGTVLVNELITAINHTLYGCSPFEPTPTPTPKAATATPGIPSIVGRYRGTTSQTTTGCEDPDDDDELTYVNVPIEVQISTQQGVAFSATASVGGIEASLQGMIDGKGTISGGTFTTFDGSGTFDGSVINGTMHLNYRGEDLPQVDTCRYTGSIDVTLVS